MNKKKKKVLTFLLVFMMLGFNLFSGTGALHAHAAGPVGNIGPSEYTTIFSYTDTSGTTKSINEMIGRSEQIGPILDKIGITNGEQDARGGITKAETDSPNVINVYEHEWAGWFVQILAGDANEHNMTVTFKDDYQVTVKVTSHKHHWTATGDGTDSLTIVCDDPQNCYFFNSIYIDAKAYTAQIIANDATYDGKPHGAEQELQTGPKINFPTPAVTVEKDIHYVGVDGTTYADSTTPPTNAGKYKAYYKVKPLGQDDVFTVQTTYSINKADIQFDPAPAAVSNLTYTGADQDLYTLGTAKSPANSGLTFPIKYWYANDDSKKVVDQVLKGKDVGTVKINYQAEGDANHNNTEVKTLEIKIGKRPVKVSGITASNKTYDGTTAATLDCSNATFENTLAGDNLTVSAKGTFADKNAGDNKTVNITDLTLGGADVDKYTLDTAGQQTSTTANIAAKTLKVKWQENAYLTYTGEEQAPKAEFEFAGELSTDDGKAFTGDDVKPVITNKNKSVGSYTATVNSLSGENAGNYKLDSVLSNVNKDYEIVPKKITVDWKVIEKVYAAQGLEPEWELTGLVEGEKPTQNLKITANPTELVGQEAVNAGTYKATLSFSGELAANYEITNPESPFTITKAPLTLYAKGWIYYGEKIESKTDIHGLEFDEDKCAGFKGNDGLEVLGNNVEFTTDYKFKDNATGVDGAKYNLIPQIEETANYTIKNKDGELTVYPKPVELEWTHEHDGTKEAVSGQQAFTYDGKDHTYTAKVSEDNVTVATYEGNKQKDTNAKTGTDKYTAKALTLSNPNYALTDKDGKEIGTNSVDFTISPKKINVDWKVIEKEYDAKGLEPDWELTGIAEGDKLTKALTLTADPTELVDKKAVNAGTYKATASITGEPAANYEITNPESDFTITPAPLTVYAKGWIYYGEKIEADKDIHGLEYDKDKSKGFKGNDGVEVLKDSATFKTNYKYMDNATGVNGAKYNLIPQFDKIANYTVTDADGELTVYPKPVKLEWTHEHAGKTETVSGKQAFTYDGKYHAYTAKASEDGVNVATYEGSKQKDANAKTGTEKYTIKALTLSNPNYALADKDGKEIGTKSVDFTIAQLPVNLKWTPTEFTYNGMFQTPVKTVANLQADEKGVKDKYLDIKVKREKTSKVFDKDRGESIEAGDWTITAISEESGQLKDKNYTLKGGTGVSQKYVIKPMPVRITWTSPQEYGYNAQPQFQTASANVLDGDRDYIELKNENASATDAGTYTYKVTGLGQKGAKNRVDNYELTPASRTWKINKAQLTITAKNKTITYGQKPANAGVTYSGFIGKDNASVLKGSAKYSYNYARYGKPGSYTITPSGLSAGNYVISYKPGTLKVNSKVTRLMAKGIAKGNNKGTISWNKVTGATSYEVWFARCDSKGKIYKLKKVATVKGTKWTTKKLAKNTFYKFRVVAKKSNGKINSSIGHFATGNKCGKFTNAKKLTVSKTAVSITKGKTFKIKAKSPKVKKNLKLPTKHASTFRYYTDNSKVAKVTKNGVIKGIGKGWCRVYVQTINGIWKTITITVK